MGFTFRAASTGHHCREPHPRGIPLPFCRLVLVLKLLLHLSFRATPTRHRRRKPRQRGIPLPFCRPPVVLKPLLICHSERLPRGTAAGNHASEESRCPLIGFLLCPLPPLSVILPLPAPVLGGGSRQDFAKNRPRDRGLELSLSRHSSFREPALRKLTFLQEYSILRMSFGNKVVMHRGMVHG